jgi:hypothetical protein
MFALQGEAQHKADAEPILDARETSQGCCERRYNRTYLRVFADGTVEWEAFDEQKQAFIAHQGTLSKKKLKSIQWAIDSMKGLKEFYVGKEPKITSIATTDSKSRGDEEIRPTLRR